MILAKLQNKPLLVAALLGIIINISIKMFIFISLLFEKTFGMTREIRICEKFLRGGLICVFVFISYVNMLFCTVIAVLLI